jgi:hypothetical protein
VGQAEEGGSEAAGTRAGERSEGGDFVEGRGRPGPGEGQARLVGIPQNPKTPPIRKMKYIIRMSY